MTLSPAQIEALPGLEPCPFCGKDSDAGMSMNMLGTRFYRLCNHCEMEGPSAATREAAAIAWNTRVPAATVIALTAENARLRGALESIANQKVRGEFSDEEWDEADFEGAYEECVSTARYAISSTPPAGDQ